MPDFLDRLGEQFQVADVPSSERQRRMRFRAARKAWFASIATLAVAAPAVAVIRPWEPKLGRSDVGGTIVASDAPVTESATAALAVLRRTQTPADRTDAAPLLKTLSPRLGEVQTDAVRILAEGWALVPVKQVQEADGAHSDFLCLVDAEGGACGPASQLRLNGVSSRMSSAKIGTFFAGLVPDGVDRVRFSPTGGDSVEAKVESNFYRLSVPLFETGGRIAAPDEIAARTGSATVPGGTGPAHGTIEWLSADGSVVGPERKDI